MIKLRVSGCSDDLIEIDGDVEEEFPYTDPTYLGFSDGTLIRIAFIGTWVIKVVKTGRGYFSVDSSEDDDVLFLDLLDDDSVWIVCGESLAVG